MGAQNKENRADTYDGYYSSVGRSKHIILSNGLNIYPAELEEAINSHQDVADCAVIGVEDETWGELPVAAVVPSISVPDIETILDHVSQKAVRYKRVHEIIIVDQIPRTPASKIQVYLV